MIIIMIIAELLSRLMGIIYVGAATWLFPTILVLGVLLMLGINATGVLAAGARSVGQLLVMLLTACIASIPKLLRRIVQFWHFLRGVFARVLPAKVASIIALVVIIII